MQALMSDIMLGNAVGDVLFEDSPATASRVMANRAVISGGLASMSVANEWMPTIRATVFGIMLFMTPIALMFILTRSICGWPALPSGFSFSWRSGA
jgi:conjugal transfer mating pair stabilization protein TraG